MSEYYARIGFTPGPTLDKMGSALLAIALTLAFTGGDASARGGGSRQSLRGCKATAKTMLQACGAEAFDDERVTVAHCLNLSTQEEQRDCQAEARSARKEASNDCRDQAEAREDACELLQEDRYDVEPLTDPSLSFVDPDTIGSTTTPNPYLSLEAGQTRVYRGGDGFEETTVVHVTDQIREILGQPCRVVSDVVVIGADTGGGVLYSAVEVTDDWYAQEQSGDVYYCGELARNFEEGILRDLDGSFEAGRDLAKSGLLIEAAPIVGKAHRQEFSLGEAEDIVENLDLAATVPTEEGGDNSLFPCAGQCLKTAETIPVEPGVGEFKYYLSGVGFVLAVDREDEVPTGVRDELQCAGDSLALLDDPDCGIENPTALRDKLCELAPSFYCAD
jgi:hypothetical protein